MKNVLKLGLSLLIMIALSSCKNEEVSIQEVQDISEMAKDEVFINLVKNNANVINQVLNIERAKELTSKDYDLSNEELNELSVSLGFADLNAYIKFYKAQSKSLIELDKRYNLKRYDDFTIQELILESGALELERFSNKSESIRSLNSVRLKTNNPEDDSDDYESAPSDCETIRISCLAIAATQVAESAICNAEYNICMEEYRERVEQRRERERREQREQERRERERTQ